MAALFKREDRVCDPLKNNIYPYTGFRLHRQYSFMLPPFKHYIRLSHCASGKVNYEAYAPVERNLGMAWATNMCGFTSREDTPMISKMERAQVKARLQDQKGEAKKQRLKNFVRAIGLVTTKNEGFANVTVEIAVAAAAANSQHPSPNAPGQWCYRVVRQKKYALRDISVYKPNSLVGGLFRCPIDGSCTSSNAEPVMPLHSDDFATQWLEVEAMTSSNPVYKANKKPESAGSLLLSTPWTALSRLGRILGRKRHVTQRVPYFYTKAKYGRRDAAYTPPGGEWPEWARALDVNEDYTYTKRDLKLMRRAVGQSMNVLSRYLSITTHTLPWERSMLDHLKKDGEVYHKIPAQAWLEKEKEREREQNEEPGQPGDPTFELQRDIISALAAFKFSKKQAEKVLGELQRPFEQLKLGQSLK